MTPSNKNQNEELAQNTNEDISIQSEELEPGRLLGSMRPPPPSLKIDIRK